VIISANGKSYLGALILALSVIGLINVVVHLCPDGDVGDDLMEYIYYCYLQPIGIPTDILRNTYAGKKDFGVPKSEIVVSKRTLGGYL
jgi:hypothetical protein